MKKSIEELALLNCFINELIDAGELEPSEAEGAKRLMLELRRAVACGDYHLLKAVMGEFASRFLKYR